jgi:aspartate dehydrogenase
MRRTKTAALIGFGAIGTEVCTTLANDPEIHIRQVLVREGRGAETRERTGSGTEVIHTVAEIEADTDIIIECAGHDAVRTYGPEILNRGFTFGIVSAGALADPAVESRLNTAARAGGGQLVVLPGAIGGTDAIAAAGPDALSRVCYTGRKPPGAWAGSPAETQFDLTAVHEPLVLFSGSARDAARAYPKNANVVATVAMAGIGFDRTEVTLIADPAATGNSHEISATGPLLDLSYKTAGGALPSNPRTSALTAMSVLRVLRNLSAPRVV